MTSPLLEFRDISKSFGSNQANQRVTFSIKSGSFHGIVGENGAGKSTIMKILYGLQSPDSGSIFLKGREIHFKSPSDAIQSGLGMVHQHFKLVPTLSVWENIILGSEPATTLFDSQSIQQSIETLQNTYGFSLSLSARVDTLPVGQQQQIEILKLLYRQAEVLILDEPTAVLSPQEIESLFTQLSTLRSKNKTIIVVSHKLKEILKFTDEVTVMRQGKVVATRPTQELNEDTLASLIMGRTPLHLKKPHTSPTEKLVLSFKNVTTTESNDCGLKDLSLEVKEKEIVGIAGIEGNGQSALVRVLAQIEKYQGSVQILGEGLLRSSLYSKRQRGFGFIPPDRQQQGLVLSFSNEMNFILGHHRESTFQSGGFLSQNRISAFAKRKIEEFRIHPPQPDLPTSALSGGNQQKLIVARESSTGTRFLLASHPTRGVDIGAIEFIHSHFLKLRDQGAGILLISSELDELLAISDRILVIREGKIVFQTPAETADIKELGLYMTGGKL